MLSAGKPCNQNTHHPKRLSTILPAKIHEHLFKTHVPARHLSFSDACDHTGGKWRRNKVIILLTYLTLFAYTGLKLMTTKGVEFVAALVEGLFYLSLATVLAWNLCIQSALYDDVLDLKRQLFERRARSMNEEA
jgi:hypothetical protein